MDNNNCPLPHHHSQWLHPTLAEMDRKIKMILELVEDNGDTFAERAEMYYKKRPQLIQLVGDIQSSYHALADKYELNINQRSVSSRSLSLRLEDHHHQEGGVPVVPVVGDDGNPSSAAQTQEQEGGEENAWMVVVEETATAINCINHRENDADDDSIKESRILDVKEDSHVPANMVSSTTNVMNQKKQDRSMSSSSMRWRERGKMWDEMRMSVSRLIEENLRQQGELIKRNDEKREYIRRLGIRMDQLQKENAGLKRPFQELPQSHDKSSSITSADNHRDHEEKKMSKLKGWLFILDKMTKKY